MASQGRFKYVQLHSSMNTIRVIDVLPGDRPLPIQCDIREIYLDDPPSYCALSYVWGECSEGHKILVDQKDMYVKQKLYEALQHLRSHEETHTFWIDAICINQLDLAEKGAQVRKMQDIYGRSNEILIWLGPEANGSASAIALASSISAYWSDQGLNLNDAESDFRSRSAADLSTLFDSHSCRFDSAAVEAFRFLLHRDWFERVWTVQEAAAPVRKKNIQCGYSKIEWSSLIVAAKFLPHALQRRDLNAYFPNAGPLNTTSLRGLLNLDQLQRLMGTVKYQTGLLRILANYRHHKATDPRDKVYALLGLVTEALTEDWVYDYSLDFSTVYLKVAEYCIMHQGSLECLGYCNPSVQYPGFPTWVPNWRDPSVRHPLAYYTKQNPGTGIPDLHLKRMYSPSADVTSQKRRISFSVPQRPKLVTEGLCIGTVVAARSPHYQDALDSENDILRGWEPDNLQDVYGPTGETILEAFSRTIVADMAKKGPLRERGYSVDWHFWRSVKNYAQPPTSPQRRVEWGSLLFATVGRRLVLSDNGYMCLAPGETQVGDRICILGGHVVYVLRPTGESWSFVGECYVHGLMDGEAMSLLENGVFKLQEFAIA